MRRTGNFAIAEFSKHKGMMFFLNMFCTHDASLKRKKTHAGVNRRGKDPKATIPAKTLEGLQAELDNLRKTKEAVSEVLTDKCHQLTFTAAQIAAGNEAKMQRVLKQHKELQTKEERLTLTLDAMKKVSYTLRCELAWRRLSR